LSNLVQVTSATFLFSDDFESGDLTNWTAVTGTGLTVQQLQVYDGNYAARATSTNAATWAYKELDAGQSNIYYRLRFKVISLGTDNVYLMRFRTSSGTSLLGVYVTSAGKLAYRNDIGGGSFTSNTNITYGVWHDLQVYVVINGSNGQTETWFDGVRIDALSKTESLGSTPVRRVQMGENSTGRIYNIAFDNVIVDTSLINMTPPAISLSEPLDNAIVREDVTLGADVSDDEGIDRVEFFANGTLIGTDYTEPYNMIWDSTAVGSGSATLTARAVDIAFNSATTAGRVVTVDNTAPNATIDSGPSGTVNSASATFTFSSSEPGSFICLIDEEEIENCGSPQTFDNLIDGPHTFQVTATDAAGNNDPTPAIRAWTSSAPPLNPPGVFNKTSPSNAASSQPTHLTLGWAASAGATSYQYCIDTTNNDTCDNNAWNGVSTGTSANLTNLLENTTFYWQIRAVNDDGTTYANSGTWWSFETRSQTFTDVDSAYWAQSFIERLYAAGITGGCAVSPLRYCPENTVTRAQMAIFLERGVRGSSYTPPAVGVSTGFADVPIDHWAAAWIKQFAIDGITAGCGTNTFCPEGSVTRAQMAVFLLKAKYGVGYTPPSVGGSTGFGDVEPTYWSAAWIKQLAAEGITGGCGGGNYCPESSVTRAQMAVFLVKTFSLP
jgi:hypothetical protein